MTNEEMYDKISSDFWFIVIVLIFFMLGSLIHGCNERGRYDNLENHLQKIERQLDGTK